MSSYKKRPAVFKANRETEYFRQRLIIVQGERDFYRSLMEWLGAKVERLQAELKEKNDGHNRRF